MSIVNGKKLLQIRPIRGMLDHKVRNKVTGVSHGLTEGGYDLRSKQTVEFLYLLGLIPYTRVDGQFRCWGHFVLISSMEKFQMPPFLMGKVLNKSTWARQGLDCAMTTNIEAGWHGHLTIEAHLRSWVDPSAPASWWPRFKPVTILAGAGICQVIFERQEWRTTYNGKYQNQENHPVPSRWDE